MPLNNDLSMSNLLNSASKVGSNAISSALDGSDRNKIWAQEENSATTAYERSQASAREAMDWSATEAQKNRDWQETMSNTAHQRQMADLSAAGLNPILAATGGAAMGGGSTGQGFSASAQKADVSTENQAIGMINSTSSLIRSIGSLLK